MTPKDDLLTWHGFLTALATIGVVGIGVGIAYLFRDAHHRAIETIAGASAVTTRGFELCPTHLRPMRSGRCLQCIPFDQELADPDFSAWESEIGGEVA